MDKGNQAPIVPENDQHGNAAWHGPPDGGRGRRQAPLQTPATQSGRSSASWAAAIGGGWGGLTQARLTKQTRGCGPAPGSLAAINSCFPHPDPSCYTAQWRTKAIKWQVSAPGPASGVQPSGLRPRMETGALVPAGCAGLASDPRDTDTLGPGGGGGSEPLVGARGCGYPNPWASVALLPLTGQEPGVGGSPGR